MTLYSLDDYHKLTAQSHKNISVFEVKQENFSLKNLWRMLFQKGRKTAMNKPLTG
jgi:hypothetical protein